MKQFPESVDLPHSVYTARQQRNRHLVKAVFIAIAIRSFIIAAELAAVFFFGSAALLMDALSSIIDVLCSLFLLLFIKLAERPPDENHPFGHGRYEPLAGLQLGLLLGVVGLGMCLQQIWHFQSVQHEAIDKRLWIIPLMALVLLEICYGMAKRAAKKHDSPALAADAAHYRIDSLTSLLATISLIISAFFPAISQVIDQMGAIAIAILMIVLGIWSVRSNLRQLLDTTPSEEYFSKVRKAAKSVTGVRDTEKIRIQLYGPDAHVDIDIEVDPQLSVESAHEISQYVRSAIQIEWPMVRDVTVHIEPFYANDH